MTTKRLSRLDREALKRSLAMARAQDAGRRQQIDSMLADKGRDWRKVAEFASLVCQGDALRLKPWEWPPCFIHDIRASLRAPPDDIHQEQNAAKLLKKMLDAGLSRFDPDPIGSLEAAEAARTIFTGGRASRPPEDFY